MELWLILGILSYLFYSISSSICKYLMNKDHDAFSANFFMLFFDFIILLIVGFLFFKVNLTLNLFLWSLLLGALYALGGIPWFVSLKLRDAGVIIPYSQAGAVLLTFIGAIFLLNESVNIYNIFGVFLILIGIYAVLSQKFKLPKLDKAFFLVFISIIFVTIYYLLVKKVLFIVKPIDLAIMVYFSATLFMLVFLLFSPKQRKSFDFGCVKMFFAAIFGSTGTLLLFYALTIGLAAKVYPIAGLQSVLVFFIASLFLKEKFYWHRLLGTIAVFFGIFLIAL